MKLTTKTNLKGMIAMPTVRKANRPFSAEQQELLRVYLLGELEGVDSALRTLVDMRSHAGNPATVDGSIAYWRNVASGLRWMLSRVGNRKRYLAPIASTNKSE